MSEPFVLINQAQPAFYRVVSVTPDPLRSDHVGRR